MDSLNVLDKKRVTKKILPDFTPTPPPPELLSLRGIRRVVQAGIDGILGYGKRGPVRKTRSPPRPLTPKEKYVFHQIHPLKLLTDWSTGLIALYLLWRHELAVAIIIMLVPPPVASWLVMRYADLEPLDRPQHIGVANLTVCREAGKGVGSMRNHLLQRQTMWRLALVGLLVVAAAGSVAGAAQATGSETRVQGAHKVTKFADGTVLVTGGHDKEGAYLSDAEIYDPLTGTLTPTGSMATPRQLHAATLLADGTVLVSGGHNEASLTSAEIYHPATGTFSTTGSLATARYHHTATLLTNGTVLVVGGFGGPGLILASAEIYDPATGTWR